MSEEKPKPNAATDEHPLANILLNVIVPVTILSCLSKDPALQEQLGKSAKFWHIGPHKAMLLALVFPLGYGVWHFIKKGRMNFFSILGLVSVLLTGGLTLYLWNPDGSIKPNAGLLFGLKEASIPLVLGAAILFSHWTKAPLLNMFLYHDGVFDLKRIERVVKEGELGVPYQKLLFRSTLIFSASFLVSTVLNFFVAQYFLGNLDETAVNALEQYNEGVAKITAWGFALIGVPIFILLIALFFYLINNLKKLTGLQTDEILLPR